MCLPLKFISQYTLYRPVLKKHVASLQASEDFKLEGYMYMAGSISVSASNTKVDMPVTPLKDSLLLYIGLDVLIDKKMLLSDLDARVLVWGDETSHKAYTRSRVLHLYVVEIDLREYRSYCNPQRLLELEPAT